MAVKLATEFLRPGGSLSYLDLNLVLILVLVLYISLSLNTDKTYVHPLIIVDM
jgi:hypothetical protein